MPEQANPRRTALAVLLVMAVLALGLFTTLQHVNELGIAYLDEGPQAHRHQAILEGRAGNPWQYRVLSTWLVEGALRLSERLHLPPSVGFMWFRVLEDAAIFLLAFFYYRKLGLGAVPALVGINLLAWGMTYASFDSDLQFNTYLDVVFYLLAGLAILSEWVYMVIPLTLLAALNRETSGLIPFLFLISFFSGAAPERRRKVLVLFAVAMVLYASVFIGLRMHFGPQKLFIPYNQHQGVELFLFNVARPITWYRLWATLGLLPVLAIAGYRHWPLPLKRFLWVIVPVWITVHLFMAVMAETRLFLVPQALIFVPGALFLVCRRGAGQDVGV